jgi:YegS/Rv2252/BmrU family lipid kinase
MNLTRSRFFIKTDIPVQHIRQVEATQRVFVVVNPVAGMGDNRGVVERLRMARRPEMTIYTTTGRDDMHSLAQSILDDGYSRVVVIGGDGTLQQVVTGLCSHRQGRELPALALVPGGTHNALAHHLGIPAIGAASIELALEGTLAQRVALGRVCAQYFAVQAGVGLVARISLGAGREEKQRLGPLAYVLSAANELTQPQDAYYRLYFDDNRLECRADSVFLTNILGVVGPLAFPDASPSDAVMELGLLRLEAFDRLLSGIGHMLIWREAPDRELQLYPVRQRVRIEASPSQPVQIDGEALGYTPVEMEAAVDFVWIVVPPLR